MNEHDNLSDEQLIELIKQLDGEADVIDIDLKRAKNTLIERRRAEIALALKQKPEPFGTTPIIIGDQKATFDTKKKVEWDQKGLGKLYSEISSDPDEDVSEYIQVEYKVKEDAYKNWPTNLKAAFEPYRTLKPQPISVKIEPVKGK